MRGFTPIILVSGASPLFYRRLIKATIRDEEGQKSDTLTFELDDRGNVIPVPKKGTRLTVHLGYRETGLWDKGTFEVHGSELKGSRDGEFIVVQARGTALAAKGKLKEQGSETFPEGATLQQVAQKIAGRNGLSLRIAGAIGSVSYPQGAYRHMQSDLDFLMRLVEQANGLMKVQGQVLAIADRGSGQSASGKPLPSIGIFRSDCVDWSYTPGDRPTYGRVVGAWIDQKTGKKKTADQKTGLDGPQFGLRAPFKTEAEARKAIDAKAKELSRKTGDVTFTVPGMGEGGAGSPLIATGFRAEINGEWRAKAREDAFTSGPSGGWTTKWEGTAPDGGKKAK